MTTTRIDPESQAANSLRPYPQNLARMPANQQANAAAAVAAASIIPPEQRAVVAGCSEYCRTCAAFTRKGGGCPGVRSGGAGVLGGAGVSPAHEPPICHSHFAEEDDR